MTLGSIALLLGVWCAAIASPGPDLATILWIASKNRSLAIWSAIGMVIGSTIWVVSSLLGLATLIQAYPALLIGVQLVGGAYLGYLGAMMMRSGFSSVRQRNRSVPTPATAQRNAIPSNAGWKWAIRRGLLTNLSNPKAILFVSAVFSKFLPPDPSWGWMVFIVLLLGAVGLAWFVGVAWVVSTAAARRRLAKMAGWIDIFAGIIFVTLAAVMLGEALTTIF